MSFVSIFIESLSLLLSVSMTYPCSQHSSNFYEYPLSFHIMISVSFNLQMEKEIKELKSQRDLAQSRLQNLLQTVGDHAKHSVNLLP